MLGKEKVALFTIKGLPFDNTYQAPIKSYLFIPGRYTEVYGEEDIAFFRAKRQCTEKKVLRAIADRITGNKDKDTKEKDPKAKGKGAKAIKGDKKAEAEKKEDKPSDKPKDNNPLENI